MNMHVDITSHSLGGGEVGGEHILCAGSGTHEPLLEHTHTHLPSVVPALVHN